MIEFDVSTKFAKCQYCDSQVFIDRSGAGFFYIVNFQMNDATAQSTFRRWTAGSKMAKDMESMARISHMEKLYFPVYMFKRRFGQEERVFVRPARSTTLPGMYNLKVPAGDIKVFDQKLQLGDIKLENPDITMDAYLKQLQGEPVEQALVFFPIYHITYDFKGAQYETIINGSSGEIYATYWPPREAASYGALAIGGFIACAGLTMLMWWYWIPAVIGLVVAVPAILYGGYWIAKNK